MAMELGSIAQGHKATNTPGTNTAFFLDYKAIKNITADRKITYAHIVVDYRPQKPDLRRIRITVGWNLIAYLHEVTK